MNDAYFLFQKHMTDLLGLDGEAIFSFDMKLTTGEAPLLHVVSQTVVEDRLELKDEYFSLEISESFESDNGFEVELVESE